MFKDQFNDHQFYHIVFRKTSYQPTNVDGTEILSHVI